MADDQMKDSEYDEGSGARMSGVEQGLAKVVSEVAELVSEVAELRKGVDRLDPHLSTDVLILKERYAQIAVVVEAMKGGMLEVRESVDGVVLGQAEISKGFAYLREELQGPKFVGLTLETRRANRSVDTLGEVVQHLQAEVGKMGKANAEHFNEVIRMLKKK